MCEATGKVYSVGRAPRVPHASAASSNIVLVAVNTD